MPVHLAQVNIAQLSAPLDSAQLSDFVSLLAAVNAAADAAPGFVWRLQTEDGDATAVRAFESDQQGHGVIVNMSVWQDLASLQAFVYGDLHRAVLRRRREWFERMTIAHTACWWVPAGYKPSVDAPKHDWRTCASTVRRPLPSHCNNRSRPRTLRQVLPTVSRSHSRAVADAMTEVGVCT